jgi:ketosteroid isomerase-like protein
MKRPIIVPVICIVVAVGTWVGTSLVAQDNAAPPNAAKLQQVMNAWATLDPAKAAVFYAKDPGLVFFDFMPQKYTGWAAYDKGVRESFKDFKSLSLKVQNDADVHVTGNTAWTTATVAVDGAMKDGSRLRLDGRWTLVWEKRGNDWLIVHEHASAPLPPPPTPPTPPAPPTKK